jgi:membrane carboxypeptidase/penicillin-binding protein
VSKNGVKKILPRDLWTAGYTPQITTVVWAGNVDGSATKSTCDGLNCAAPIWKAYMGYALASKKNVEFTEPKGMYKATISRLSGKLASENTPDSARVSTLLAVKPTLYDM